VLAKPPQPPRHNGLIPFACAHEGQVSLAEQIGIAMDAEAQAIAPSTENSAERRKHSRHRYIEQIYVGKSDGLWFTAMTYEISATGLSAATTVPLAVGEKVSLSPVAEKRVQTIVRRKTGAMYGFEFLGVATELQEQIQKLCDGLPLFQSLIEGL
jgi:PilZ domain